MRRSERRPASASCRCTCTGKNGLKPGKSQKPLPVAGTRWYCPRCSPLSERPTCARVIARMPPTPFPLHYLQRTPF